MAQTSKATNTQSIVERTHVLVVDDSSSIREIETALLKEMGFGKVSSAVDGEKAYKFLFNNNVNLIICDWDMPNLNGLELLVKLKGLEKFKDIPFLMVSGSNEESRVRAAIKAGISSYMVKPFQPKDFCYKVIKLLSEVEKQIS